MSEQRTIVGPDGRRLEVELAGPENGRALLFHCGTPSAGRVSARLVEEGERRGLRHITYSRPGYGTSERNPGRTVADCVPDVSAIADALGVEQLFTVGWSGGGPHALACAALLGERVLAAATIASVAPRDAEGLDWLAGMGEENLEEFAAAEGGDAGRLQAYLETAREEIALTSGPELSAALGDLVSQVDREALSGEFAEYVATSMQAGLAHGPWGWFDDDIACIRRWGFALEGISRPVSVWQGEQDRFVPFAHGKWLAAHVPCARAQLLDGHGHMSLVLDCYGDLLDDLIAHAG
jgi:pimeloyl-ACP methyl ester carboxylesterase